MRVDERANFRVGIGLIEVASVATTSGVARIKREQEKGLSRVHGVELEVPYVRLLSTTGFSSFSPS